MFQMRQGQTIQLQGAVVGQLDLGLLESLFWPSVPDE